MTKVSSLASEVRMTVLGYDNADASDGILFQSQAKISVDKSQHAVFIGLGGQGTQTVNKIKREVQDRFSNWRDHVAFLALDTAEDDLRQLTALEGGEKYCIVDDAGIDLRYNEVRRRSPFTQRWIYPKFNMKFDSKGANQCRQAMKAKMFDKGLATQPKDERIRDAVANVIRSAMRNNFANGDTLSVHIFCGISGGTGSGSIVEIAHFVQRVVPPRAKTEVIGYLMLPDTVEDFADNDDARQKLYTNGYAALKELDYYYSFMQREDVFKDYLYMNGDAIGRGHLINLHHPLYDTLYLVSKGNASRKKPNVVAIETLAEIMVNQLAQENDKDVHEDAFQGWSSALSNERNTLRNTYYEKGYDNGTSDESFDFFGEDTFAYDAVGVATANIPEHSIKSFVISKAMRTLFGDQEAFIAQQGFQAFNRDACTQQIAAKEIEQLIDAGGESVTSKIKFISDEILTWKNNFKPILHADIIKGNTSELNRYLPGNAFENAKIKVEKWLAECYEAYLTELENFLKQYGPAAYRDMWQGNDSAGVAYSQETKSLKTIIEDYKKYRPRNDRDEKVSALSRCRDEVAEKVWGHLPGRSDRWHNAYLELKRADLAQELTNHVFGRGEAKGVYEINYLDKIDAMSQAVVEFSYVLDELFRIYKDLGDKFESYTAMRNASVLENATNVNIIAADEKDYLWAKEKVIKSASSINFTQLKEELIKSFMDDPQGWTEYDEANPLSTPRKKLDAILETYVRFTNDISVVQYLLYKQTQETDLKEEITDIVRNLTIQSQPLYDGKPLGSHRSWLIVPNQLFAGNSDLKNKLIDAVGQAESDLTGNITIVESVANGSDKLIMYRYYFSLPLYALNGLKTWQDAYDASQRQMVHSNESNKGIYNTETGLAWEDYPSLVLSHNPEIVQPGSAISREGRFYRDHLNGIFKEALDQGVIVRNVNTNGEYSYHCNILQVLVDESNGEYTVRFDITGYRGIAADASYLKGDDLFAYIGKCNSPEIECKNVQVELLGQSKFTDAIKDEKEAELRAKRIIRRNVPMFLKIKETLRRLKPIFAEIDQKNQSVKIALQARKKEQISVLVANYLATGLLKKDLRETYYYNNTRICSLDEGNLMIVQDLTVQHGYYYEYLCKCFADQMLSDDNILTAFTADWQNLVAHIKDEGPEALQYLERFSAEAYNLREQCEKYAEKKQLRTKLDVTEAEMDAIQSHYDAFIKVYEYIKKHCS